MLDAAPYVTIGTTRRLSPSSRTSASSLANVMYVPESCPPAIPTVPLFLRARSAASLPLCASDLGIACACAGARPLLSKPADWTVEASTSRARYPLHDANARIRRYLQKST